MPGENEKKEDAPLSPRTPGPRVGVGIENLGATCFLNATFKYLQAHAGWSSLLGQDLAKLEGESDELFAARAQLRQSLLAIHHYLKEHRAEADHPMPGSFTRAFIAAWNHIYEIEENHGTFVVGLTDPLQEKEQGDAAEVARALHVALGSPSLQVLQEFTALDADHQVLANLIPKVALRQEEALVRLGLGQGEKPIALQAILEDTYGPHATTLLEDLAIWRTAGESSEKHLASQKRWLSVATSDHLSMVIEDRIYHLPPDRQLHKNTRALVIPNELDVPVWQEGLGMFTKKMRLRSVIVHVGSAAGGHYYTVVNEEQADGSFRLVTHDDQSVIATADLEAMARGARLVHYEAIP